MNYFTKTWIESIPKTINENGCWIPNKCAVDKDGYPVTTINSKSKRLCRVVLCLWHNIDYSNPSIDTRHSTGCIVSCFNPEHIKPGTHTDNMRDKIRDGTNHNINKEVCPKCKSPYDKKKRRRNGKITWERFCRSCTNEQERRRSD